MAQLSSRSPLRSSMRDYSRRTLVSLVVLQRCVPMNLAKMFLVIPLLQPAFVFPPLCPPLVLLIMGLMIQRGLISNQATANTWNILISHLSSMKFSRTLIRQGWNHVWFGLPIIFASYSLSDIACLCGGPPCTNDGRL